MNFVRARKPSLELALAGFSFGAMVALGVAQAEAPKALITVAPPVMRIPNTFRRPLCPWLIVQGDSDDVVPAAQVAAWQQTFVPPPEYVLMRGAGHYFDGRLTPLAETVTHFLDPLNTSERRAGRC